MMQTILQLLAIGAISVGTIFSLLGVLGFHRFPDVYTRLHATGKVGVFGVVLLVVAVALVVPGTAGRSLVLVAMLLFVGPVAAHALASAAYQRRVPLRGAVRDDLAPFRRRDAE